MQVNPNSAIGFISPNGFPFLIKHLRWREGRLLPTKEIWTKWRRAAWVPVINRRWLVRGHFSNLDHRPGDVLYQRKAWAEPNSCPPGTFTLRSLYWQKHMGKTLAKCHSMHFEMKLCSCPSLPRSNWYTSQPCWGCGLERLSYFPGH